MYLKSLSLRQFRNYSRLDVSPSSHMNLLIGPNGAGKSNLLEAVAVLATGQSHRGADLKHLVQWEKEEYSVKGSFEGEEKLSLEIRQKKGRPRQVLLNGDAQKRLRDWVGRVPVVSFSPDDLHLVKGEPAVRRRVFNAILCQVNAGYLEGLQRYNKILLERNTALRQVQEGEEERGILDPWDGALLKEGIFLSLARRAFMEDFEPRVRREHSALSSERESVRLVYKPSFHLLDGDGLGALAAGQKRLRELREAEVAVGATLVGPHRDDFDLVLDGNPARAYASQGQQRTLALAIKLAEYAFLWEALKRRPLGLLDDMFSELDSARRKNLMASLARDSQCLVSLTALFEWPGARDAFQKNGSCVFDVRDGQLFRAREV